MIARNDLEQIINGYSAECRIRRIKPRFSGLAERLNISVQTLYNANSGQYNGRPYGDKPSINRCISNDDFDLIRGL